MGKILVVDDQSGIRILLCEVLRKEGYEVFEAENGIEALKLFDEKQPELVFLDMKIPGMSGIEILKAMKERNSDIFVMMMTAYGELNLVEEAFQLGAITCFEKPFDINDIRAAVNDKLVYKC